ncbi:MAG: T9SS type A sorting domain-containing protein [Bacteroidetes bacterium]|nr:T9SS type A sorting domain-containing protein [Bacteroidota bacterium]
MKKIFLFLFIAFISQSLCAQSDKNNADVTFIKCSEFGISKPIRDLPDAIEESGYTEAKDAHDRRKSLTKTNRNAVPLEEDPIAQKNNGNRSMMSPIANWDGIGGSSDPLDPSGSAGPNHYVQAINVSYRVFDKTGTPLINAKSLSTLWSGSTNDGDPIVLYDKFADRWFISQFQSSGNKVLIAISKTPDPTGAFYTYTFVPASSDFPDYLKFSIWSDGYYMSTNFSTKRMVVFERVKMLAGDATARMVVKTMPSIPEDGFFCPLSTDAAGQLPPSGTHSYMFTFEDDGWASGNTDQIRIYKMTTDWTTPTNTTIVLDQTLPTQPFDAVLGTNWNDISQKGTTKKIDGIASIFSYRAQYRIWTGYNTVTLCHPVKVNATTGQVAIRWYELRQNSSTKAWSIYQQGTYAPDSENRWLGSIAMDDNGNIGIAYAVSGTNTYPSLRYTGRLAGDPLGQMTFTEQTAINGTTAKTNNNRFGDYSHTSLDPDGVTFWHTGMYQSSGNKSRIFSFKISGITTGINENANQVELNVYKLNDQLNCKVIRLSSNDEVSVDLFDITGKQINGKNVTPVSNSFETTIDINGLAKGVYLVRVGNVNFQRVIKVMVE